MNTRTTLQLVAIGLLAFMIIELQPLNNATPTIDAISSFMQSAGLLPAGS